MKITDISPYINKALTETLGESAVTTDDLSNFIDQGEQIKNANLTDTLTKNLMNQVGEWIFVERKYDGIAPSLYMDGSEYGSIMLKSSAKMPEAMPDQSWQLNNGTNYADHTFYGTEITTKLYNSTNPYEFRISKYYDQLKQSLRSPEEMLRFWSMVTTDLQNSATNSIDNTIRATINNAIASTVNSEANSENHTKVIKIRTMFNSIFSQTLTAQAAMLNPDFIRFSVYVMNVMKDKLRGQSVLFNIGGAERFTPADRLHTILLSQFKQAAGVYLYDGSGQFRTDNLDLPTADVVPYWQGLGTNVGTDLGYTQNSSINVKTSGGDIVTVNNVIGVMFDKEMMGVYNKKDKVTSSYTAAADFWTFYYKYRTMYFNDFNENCIVFLNE